MSPTLRYRRRRADSAEGASGAGSSIHRAKKRAMTLIEVLIVMALIALVLGAVVVGSGQLSSSRLRHSSTMLTGAIRVGFARATATSKTVRLVMDFGENAIWLEEGDQPHLVQSKDVTGTGGASPATAAEQQALAESSRIMKGPTIPKTAFKEIDAMGVAASEPGKGHKPLDRGIKFRSVQSQHDDAPRTEGRAYLYFWPGGMTERSAIQLRVGESEDPSNIVTLVVQPLTGRVTVKSGPVEIVAPKDDQEASEREDPGAF
jgi:general secretion pathway protein H